MSKEWEPEDVFEVLASEDARRILAATSARPLSAKQLEEVCDSSLPTVYRRVNALLEYDLLSEEPAVDDGTQYSRYRTDLQEISVRVEDGSLDVDIRIRKDAVDRFAELIDDLESADDARGGVGTGTGAGTDAGPGPGPDPDPEG